MTPGTVIKQIPFELPPGMRTQFDWDYLGAWPEVGHFISLLCHTQVVSAAGMTRYNNHGINTHTA